MKIKKTVLLLGLLGFTFFCSKSNTDPIMEKSQILRTRIRTVEEQYGQNDPQAKTEVNHWLRDIQDAEKMNLEGRESEALAMLDKVRNSVEAITMGRTDDLKLNKLYGVVKLSGKKIDVGSPVFPGSTLSTSGTSFAELSLFVDSSVTLGVSSELKIEKVLPWSRSVFANLQAGSLKYKQNGGMSKFFLHAGAKSFELRQPGEFELFFKENGNGFLLPIRGNIHLIEENERKRIPFGEGYFWSSRQSRTEIPMPSPELLSPRLEQNYLLENGVTKRKITLEWSEVPQASGYIVGVFEDPDLTKPLMTDQIVESTSYTKTFETGVFYWTIRAVNVLGFPGYPSKISWFSVVGEEDQSSSSNLGPKLSNIEIQLMNDMAIVTGKVSNQASVSVNNTQAVRGLDGRFEVVLSLQMGEQYITIVATGKDGVQTIEKRKVNTEF